MTNAAEPSSTSTVAANDRPTGSKSQRRPLNAAEEEFIAYFVEVTRLLAVPKSVGEVYGLLYCSPSPLTVGEITEKLGVCKATVSYAMRFLGNINAISITKEIGNRNDFFSATTSLRQLASGFLARRVEPFLAEREADLDGLQETFRSGEGIDPENRDFIRKRIKTLRSWNRQGRLFMPLLRRLFRSKD